MSNAYAERAPTSEVRREPNSDAAQRPPSSARLLLILLAARVAGFIGDEQHAGDEDNNGCNYGPEH